MAFTMPQKLLFKHCDPAGIAFYPRYFEMMNDCVELFFDHIGHPFEEIIRTAGVPTARIEAQFTAPSRHGDRLEITLRATSLGRSSLGLTFAALCGEEVRFRASSTLVYVTQQGRPQSWSDTLRAALTPHVEGKN
ncbi:4-hydroxybenzoyl-CoA thioesterase [Salinihabitans flavidus]|uniref:4-hydroxybenzoyl-CoA thioesterase n=1 Tax=Salinihabitans flavidus TaxID=569882 RepID=A0A1H8U5V3_9RHOB|nr:thioesterase family protein [Salinihabitans flavidus]SEO98436.1 4-hydroxybenzoyl-CoA thioesterase [Salinihabitans flavidus]